VVQEAIRDLKVAKTQGPNSIPNRVLKHLAQLVVSLLVLIFNAILVTHLFPTVWKHFRVISVLKSGTYPAMRSTYRPISLLDTISKLFEKILFSRILHEVKVRGLLRNEQFGFRPRHGTSLQLARLVERITRNFGEKRLAGAVFRRPQLELWLGLAFVNIFFHFNDKFSLRVEGQISFLHGPIGTVINVN